MNRAVHLSVSGNCRAEALTNIPTAYSISECIADLLELASRNVVSSRLDPATVERFKEMGFSAHRRLWRIK